MSKIYSDRPSIASKQQLAGTRLFHPGNAQETSSLSLQCSSFACNLVYAKRCCFPWEQILRGYSPWIHLTEPEPCLLESMFLTTFLLVTAGHYLLPAAYSVCKSTKPVSSLAISQTLTLQYLEIQGGVNKAWNNTGRYIFSFFLTRINLLLNSNQLRFEE